jgi:hypothetical protein
LLSFQAKLSQVMIFCHKFGPCLPLLWWIKVYLV